jgi:hypothetical protein
MTTIKEKNEQKVNRIFIRGLLIIVLVVFLPNLYNLVFGKIVQGKVMKINTVPSIFGSNITSSYPVILINTGNGWYKFVAEQNLISALACAWPLYQPQLKPKTIKNSKKCLI